MSQSLPPGIILKEKIEKDFSLRLQVLLPSIATYIHHRVWPTPENIKTFESEIAKNISEAAKSAYEPIFLVIDNFCSFMELAKSLPEDAYLNHEKINDLLGDLRKCEAAYLGVAERENG